MFKVHHLHTRTVTYFSKKMEFANEIIDRMEVADPFRIPIGSGNVALPYQPIHRLHTQAFQAYSSGNIGQAFSYEHTALAEVLKVFHEDKSGKHVPVLLTVARNTRDLGYQSGQLLKAEATIKKGLVECIASKNKQKKWGAIEMSNQLMWIYFRLTKLSLCGTLIPQVDRATSRMSLSMDEVPMSHRVTSQYYRGRLALFNLDPVGAEVALDFAFQHCPKSSPHNKRLILHSLVPAKLLHGKYPSPSLLKKYNCHQYINLVHAVKNGDVGLFESCVTRHQVFFIKKGLFMLIPWIRMLLHRNLFYRISQLNLEISTDAKTAHHIDLNKCETIMTSLSKGKKIYDKNVVQCILAGLIDHRFIKGYLSHKLNKMVLAKKNAFVKVEAHMFRAEQ